MTPSLDWGRLSRLERDLAFNNTEACPGSPAYVAEMRAASEAFRVAESRKLDLRYGPTDRTAWDLFPAADPAAPCLVFIHGGYWQRNARDGSSVLVTGIRAHGWSAALPGYTLAPDATLTQIVAEITSALDWLAAEGPSHGIAGPIVVCGWSAGGHLAGMAAAHPAVAAALPISGIFELGPIRDTYLNEKLSLIDTEIATLSPLRLPVVNKPVSIAYGSAELPALRDNSRDFHAHRSAAHAPGALLPVAGADHFTVLDALRSPNGVLVRAAMDLLR
jgi:acetyl esterase/lipase